MVVGVCIVCGLIWCLYVGELPWGAFCYSFWVVNCLLGFNCFVVCWVLVWRRVGLVVVLYFNSVG